MSEPAGALERERIDVSGGVGPVAATRAAAAWAWLRHRWAIVAVLAAFFATTLIVPVLTPVATTDDWAYARSAEILLHDHVLRIFPVVAATAVFPVVWGALFGALFGPSFGIFRLSTVVITALGGWALYGLCRELGVSRGRSALGAAAYLFNPLAFVLAFTFMTDPFFTAVLVIATYFTARGLNAEPNGGRWLTAGSGAAALALLTRQQGALIPLAIAIFLLVTGRLRPNRAGLATLLRIGALPVVAGVAYLLWLRFVNDVPSVQTTFLREAAAEGWAGTWWLLRRLTFAALAYLGLFALPIAVAALPAGRRLLTTMSGRGKLVFALWEGVLLLGVGAAWTAGRRMPYLSQFFGSGGLGPSDVLGSRPHLLDANALGWLTVVCVGASLLLALLAARGASAPPSRRANAGLVLAIGLGQVVGVLPPSFHYIGWTAGSLDRYLLPLLPFAIALSLWAARGVRLALPLGWLTIALLAAFAIAGTRDYLVLMNAVWDMARTANAAGVSNERLDAGSAWDGYHLYEESLAGHIKPRALTKGPWWVYFYAPATDSSYVVATKPQPGYVVAMSRPYPAWLARGPTQLYVLRRLWMPWPARPAR